MKRLSKTAIIAVLVLLFAVAAPLTVFGNSPTAPLPSSPTIDIQKWNFPNVTPMVRGTWLETALSELLAERERLGLSGYVGNAYWMGSGGDLTSGMTIYVDYPGLRANASIDVLMGSSYEGYKVVKADCYEDYFSFVWSGGASTSYVAFLINNVGSRSLSPPVVNVAKSNLPAGVSAYITTEQDAQKLKDEVEKLAIGGYFAGTISFSGSIPAGQTVTVHVDYPGLKSNGAVDVLHLKNDGSFEVIKAVCYNDYFTFTVSSFSSFAFILQNAGSSTVTPTSPQTDAYS